MPVHDEVLSAALRICRQRGNWRFRPIEIVRALPDLDPGTVRTHVVSRCCTNAPAHHPHRWGYFERVGRGEYEILRSYRRRPAASRRGVSKRIVAERSAQYASKEDAPPRDTIHAVARRSGGWYVAECLEVAVVTQGRTLDELVANLRDAVDLHLDGEDAASLGMVAAPRLAVTYELAAPAR